MADEVKLNKPWLVACWPGMGHVAITAGYYLMAKLGMHLLAEFSAAALFDIEHVEVKDGLIHTARLPRSRFFAWTNPRGGHDIVMFIGEAQPPLGKYAFCQKLIEFAQQLGVERVFTFAALATRMHPERDSRVFSAATDEETLNELKSRSIEILEDGHIGGLNGVLLGVTAETGSRGSCLLGEMPHIFAQLPFPKASLAVLKIFTQIADIEIDLTELSQQAQVMDQRLGEILSKVEHALEQETPAESDEEEFPVDQADENGLSPEDEQRVEKLFEQARQDRSKAYELKRELDRLERFREYEDRFLDLFKKAE